MIDLAGKNCLASGCHGDMTSKRFVHAPVLEGNCTICHVVAVAAASTSGPTLHKFPAVAPTLELCGKCHKDLNRSFRVIHAPFGERCTACHDPHGGAVRYFIVGDSIPALCLHCHEKVLEKKPVLHAPAAFQACEGCHTAHASDYRGLLARPPEKVCFYCHVDWALAADRAVSVHAPARKACFDCHNPHGGESRGFLPASEANLCRQCHAALFEQMERARYPHEAMVEGKTCSDCHDPHWAGSTMLLEKPSMQICLGCHDDSVRTHDGRLVAAVGQLLAQSSFVHGPIEQQDCTPCHATHGSDDPRLMKANFPLGFYAPFSDEAYALCFGCHDPNIVRKDRPLATGFRNGEENLHFFHVCEGEGRSCRACHHEHASNEPFHIRDWVMFGKWKMEILFQPTQTGGTCITGCHSERSYDRLRPVDNTLPQRLEVLWQTPPAEAAATRGGWTHLMPGAAAPDFTLQTLSGETTVTLGGIAGQRLLVLLRSDQRFTTETLALCERLPKQLPRIRGQLTPILIWVGPVPNRERASLAGAPGNPWLTLEDPQGETARAYRMVVSPTMFLVNSQGRITHVFPAWHPRLETNLRAILVKELMLAPGAELYKTTEEMLPESRAALYLRLARELDREGRSAEARSLSEQVRSLVATKGIAVENWERRLEEVLGIRPGPSKAQKAVPTHGRTAPASSPTLRALSRETTPTIGNPKQ